MTYLELTHPGKIIAVGLNYRSHADELGMAVPSEPVIFLKPPSSVIGHGEEIIIPRASEQVDYEAELAIVIGKTARKITVDEAASHVLGYACANDVTARDLQRLDGQWTRSKSFDTFCPLGPWLETRPPAPEAKVELFLNGARRQSATISDMIFSPLELVAFISGVMTLDRGDVILTGTPPGVGRMKAGDEVTVRIDGIGELTNSVTLYREEFGQD